MKYFVFLFVAIAVAAAIPVQIAEDVVEDEEGQQYYLVPVSRTKRQATKWGITETGVGASHQGTIFSNNNHQLDGTAFAAKNFRSHGLEPDQLGGRLDYSHRPSGSGAFLSADHTRHLGTDVNAGLKYNFINRKNFELGAVAQYGRHFGGPFGTGRPEGYLGLGGMARF